MTRTQITLYSESTEQFEATRERLDEVLPGSEPGNAEVVRMLMDVVDDVDDRELSQRV